MKQWVSHAMKWKDGRFARRPTFRYVAPDMLMRERAMSASRYFVKKSGGQDRQITRVVGEKTFSSFSAAYGEYSRFYQHFDDYYDDYSVPNDEEEFVTRKIEEETDEDFEELRPMLPERLPEEGPLDQLGRRDLDKNYDWKPHVGRYSHPCFADSTYRKNTVGSTGTYWRDVVGSTYTQLSAPEVIPLGKEDGLNAQQRIVYDTVIGHCQRYSKGLDVSQLLMQVDGGGGTGKTHLIKILASHLREILGDEAVVLAAPTGVASSNIRGNTIHSLFRLPLRGDFTDLNSKELDKAQWRFENLRYLIIDEKSMLSLRLLSWINRRLQQIFHSDDHFGGVNVLLIGDFYQLPPVKENPLYTPQGTAELTDDETAACEIYKDFKHSVFLSTPQRQLGEDQAPFRQALQELRTNQVTMDSYTMLSARVASVLTETERASFDNALRIFPLRKQVDLYNYEHVASLFSPAIQVRAKHEGYGAHLASSATAGNLSATLPLCVGARVMLLRNLSTGLCLVNGSQGTVYDIGWAAGDDPHNPEHMPLVVMVAFDKYEGPAFYHDGVELLTASGQKVVPILRERAKFYHKETSCVREQFPLTLCYAITVHKSQGITVDQVVTQPMEKEFSAGLNYVACSRVTSLQGLMFCEPFDRKIMARSPGMALELKLKDREKRESEPPYQDRQIK